MTRYIFSLVLLLVFDLARAQRCNEYVPLANTCTFEYKNFDGRGELTGWSRVHIDSIVGNDSAKTARMHSEFYNLKDVKVQENYSTITCRSLSLFTGNYVDVPVRLNAGPLPRVEASGDDIDMPIDPQPGDSLKELHVTYRVYRDAYLSSTNEITYKNRKVTGREVIPFTNGFINAVKLTYTMESKLNNNGIVIPTIYTVHEWYSVLYGVVKTETFQADGTKVSFRLLSKKYDF